MPEKQPKSQLVSISLTSYARRIHMKVLLGSLFQLRFGFGAKIRMENARINVDEIDTRCQWHKELKIKC